MTASEYPVWVWLMFFGVVLTALFVDIGIVNRRSHAPTRKETVIWSIVWVSLALAFNGFVLWQFGWHKAQLFLTGYIIELSLSVDNLFVFLLIFSYFKVPKKYQHRVLFWGIIGALVMRMIMIFAGAELVDRFHWVIYIFGSFLIYTGVSMFRDEDDNFEPHESAIIRFTTKYVRFSKHYDGDKFFIVKDGARIGTLLLLVLIVVEFTDLVFAVDSIPAIFGITTDRFIIYTSNVFAILGLRTFYFLLAGVVEKFHYLKTGLGIVLGFIGVKMLLPLLTKILAAGFLAIGYDAPVPYLRRLKDIPIVYALGFVALVLLASVGASLIWPRPVDSDSDVAENIPHSPRIREKGSD